MDPGLPNADEQTLSSPGFGEHSDGAALLALTVIWHPRPMLLGAQCVLPAPGVAASLSRSTPFRLVEQTQVEALGHAAVSRRPTRLLETPGGGLRLCLPDTAMHCELDGQQLHGEFEVSPEAIERGAVLIFGGIVALCLHRVRCLPDGLALGELAGLSSAMVSVRRQIAQVASTELPVLILGESGTGKELVAQAVHAQSRRRDARLITVNMAAMSESLAASDLFGATRGAYTGAQTARAGYWREAHDATLFLDEVGDTPALVQPMLLRAIESGEFRPLGACRDERADVRLIAATDRDLQSGSFNQPLLRRLEAFVIRTPPLRQRREDLGLLALLALQEEGPLTEMPRLPQALLRALCMHDWPGNVRQFMHAMRRVALQAQRGQGMDWPSVHELLGGDVRVSSMAVAGVPAHDPVPTRVPAPLGAGAALPASRSFRAPSSVSEQELIAALDAAGWRLSQAAEGLGISRPSLYNLIRKHAQLRSAESLQPAEVVAALEAGHTDLADLAVHLRIPQEALRRRMDRLQADGCLTREQSAASTGNSPLESSRAW
ncbi:sigma-54-dependent transcriptional regulator [Roseateles sp.]|uniref:sigma-54-dependent transcriptional regulator n=1 Tax=Roseateles sp. TaxID=1971397 RepID=UPI0039EB2C79